MRKHTKRICLWLFCLGAFTPVFGQADTSKAPLTCKIVSLNLINPVQASLDLRMDIPLGRRWAFEAGGGYIFDSAPFAQNQGEKYRGVKIRPALKYYFGRSKTSDEYLSVVYRYHTIWNDRYLQAMQQGGQYAEWVTGTRRLEVHGVSLNIGTQLYTGKRNRFVTEIYTGLGFRWMHVGGYTVPNLVVPINDDDLAFGRGIFWQDRFPGNYASVDFCVGLNFGWRFDRKNARNGR